MRLLGLSFGGLNMLQMELLSKRCGLGCRDVIADTVASSREHYPDGFSRITSPFNLTSLTQLAFTLVYAK